MRTAMETEKGRCRQLQEELNSKPVAKQDQPQPSTVSMFSTASKLFGTATSVAAAATSALAAAAEEGERLPKESNSRDGALEDSGTGASEHLRTQLDVANVRLAHLQDQLQAERAAHGQSAMKALRDEVSALAESLARERQEKQREKMHMEQVVRQAKEDLRHQAQAAAQADASGLLQQAEQLRRQRDQARGIAQCIARQVSSLAEELYRLRREGGVAASNGQGASRASPSRLREPERGHASEEVAGAGSAGALSSSAGGIGEGDEGSVPRPPDEVTSGWDVFNPDDQLENTIPTAPSDVAGPHDGWGEFDLDDLA
eukprot:TRINITY_DN4852_c0_g1_i6.p1 TRINITY_DN4852_c0_g1~~TRINITY_DN4852_c0_g1_i6.p1  ORF type:complete len:316 (-),score=85.09 TRINITY_DN4852_c0_g1_i6:99-1046(-)